MEILLFAGSLRKDSLNKKLIQAAVQNMPDGISVSVVDIKSLQIPIYDGDIENENFPQGVQALGAQIAKAQALVIASPEYNGSISSPLKNTIDWLSRLKPHPLLAKPVLLMSASPGALGGVRGLLHARIPFESLGAFVYPQTLGIAKADTLLPGKGEVADAKTKERLVTLLKDFVSFANKVR
jgi:chromate reductase, NAD(P)H dehydrogenase (quinone)